MATDGPECPTRLPLAPACLATWVQLVVSDKLSSAESDQTQERRPPFAVDWEWQCQADIVPEAVSKSAKAAHVALVFRRVSVPQQCQIKAAHWASWADSIKMIGERHPEVVATILRALDENSGSRSIEAINSCTQH